MTACLGALEAQRDGSEAIVCASRPSPAGLLARFSWARFVDIPGALVPELWRDGIDRSRGRIVALTTEVMIPAPNWIETIRAQHVRHDAIGGAIDAGDHLRVSDWAEYFCRYWSDMPPFEAHRCLDLPGDNAAYDRELLERTRELYRDGFWEPVVHRALAETGTMLWHAPELVVRQGRSAGVRAFVSQRLVHGRANGRQRGERFRVRRNLLAIGGAPLVPAVLTFRILRTVLAKRRHRFRAVVALPYVLLFNVAWAAGEWRGHLESL